MALTTATRNAMLDTLDGLIGKVSLHTADPGATGVNEVAGGSPAYARQNVTFAAAAGSSKSSNVGVTFDVPASTTITHLGYWSAGGTFRGSEPLDVSQVFVTQGTYTLPSGAIAETAS